MPIMGLEWIWIVLIIIIFLVGPKKLPEVAKAVGRAMGEFQKARQQIDTEFKSASHQIDNEVKSATDVVKDATAVVKDSTSNVSEVSDRKNLFDAAQALGIFPYGKTNDELSQMIKEKVDEKKDILPVAQDGGQQAVQGMVNTDHSKDDLPTTKSTDQRGDLVAKQKNIGQKLGEKNLRKIEDTDKVAKKKANTAARGKSQSKTSPRTRKSRNS